MMRQEVLSLLERFPELFDGDDDLLHDLITDSRPELSEREARRPEPIPRAEPEERSAKHPR